MAGLTRFANNAANNQRAKTSNQRTDQFVPKDQRRDLAEIIGTPTLRQLALDGLESSAKNLLGQLLPSNSGALNGEVNNAIDALRSNQGLDFNLSLFGRRDATPLASTSRPLTGRTAGFSRSAPEPPVDQEQGAGANTYFSPSELPSPVTDLVSAGSLRGLGPVAPNALLTAREIATLFGNPLGMGGVGPRGNKSDHPGGKAIDVMITRADSNTIASGAPKQRGDNIVGYLLANWQRLGVKYVIWNGRLWNSPSSSRSFGGGGGDGYGGKHGNHVHISFT